MKQEREEAEVAGANPKDKASPTGLPHQPYFMQPPGLSRRRKLTMKCGNIKYSIYRKRIHTLQMSFYMQ